MASAHDWFYWALLSAVFAALTAIFAKLGLVPIPVGHQPTLLEPLFEPIGIGS
jgi:uncharacterized membrane protein